MAAPHQVAALLLRRRLEGHGGELGTEELQPRGHHVPRHQVWGRGQGVTKRLRATRGSCCPLSPPLPSVPILLSTSTRRCRLPALRTAASSCGLRQPCGSRASNTSSTTSAASNTSPPKNPNKNHKGQPPKITLFFVFNPKTPRSPYAAPARTAAAPPRPARPRGSTPPPSKSIATYRIEGGGGGEGEELGGNGPRLTLCSKSLCRRRASSCSPPKLRRCPTAASRAASRRRCASAACTDVKGEGGRNASL